MIVDFLLDAGESLVRALLGIMPEMCHADAQGCGDGFLTIFNISTGLETVMGVFAFANYFLPINMFFLVIASWFFALGVMAVIRIVWRLIPGLG